MNIKRACGIVVSGLSAVSIGALFIAGYSSIGFAMQVFFLLIALSAAVIGAFA